MKVSTNSNLFLDELDEFAAPTCEYVFTATDKYDIYEEEYCFKTIDEIAQFVAHDISRYYIDIDVRPIRDTSTAEELIEHAAKNEVQEDTYCWPKDYYKMLGEINRLSRQYADAMEKNETVRRMKYINSGFAFVVDANHPGICFQMKPELKNSFIEYMQDEGAAPVEVSFPAAEEEVKIIKTVDTDKWYLSLVYGENK